MVIDANTKIIARLHTESNGTGLNIYNPYLQEQGLNVVYLLFKNRTVEPLITSIRNLQLSGAITAGFEHDANLPNIVDEKSEAVNISGRVGSIVNNNGVLRAHYQGGEGLLAAIREKIDLSNKVITIVGAGTVAKTFLLALEASAQKPRSVIVYNRTMENGYVLRDRFNIITTVNPLEKLKDSEGDILINASRIGSKIVDSFYTEKIVSRFTSVADVTLGTEQTNLISMAKITHKTIVSGWDFFTHHVAVVLKMILNHEADIDRLRHFVKLGLAVSNHGAVH